ncbi:MAG: hypothetical protein H6672_06615 [Anaerolineaceae bacterium]|nr:hypothetical protein [Anaerolineaceae bacterium]
MDIMTIVSVVVLFILRIGIPVLVLVGLGVVIDRWQRRREADIETKYNKTA